jgi:hypothetical protein
VKEALERREWNFKIESLVDYNSDSEDIDWKLIKLLFSSQWCVFQSS